jgi:hypothetical protein
MSGFAKRLELSQHFEKCCLAYFKGRGIDYTVNGSEHTHAELVKRFRDDDSLRARQVRFTPDTMVYMEGNLCYFEAKAGQTIEKAAYLTYLHIIHHAMPVVVMLWAKNGLVKWQFCERIRFLSSADIVAKHGQYAHPIDAEGWIVPRMGHGFAGNGSGTPYREVQLSSMNTVRDFWQVLIEAAPHLIPRPDMGRFGGGI